MQKNTMIDITINANPTRFLIRAVLFTVFCLISLVVFSEFNSANVDPVKGKVIRATLPLFWVVTIFSWYQYIQTKKHKLIITDHKIAWGCNNKARNIEWTGVQTVSIIELANISSQSGFVYEFTTVENKTGLDKPFTLFGKDYPISHKRLMEIFQLQAKQYNFILKLY
jgi:hypothetical protein